MLLDAHVGEYGVVYVRHGKANVVYVRQRRDRRRNVALC